MIIKFDQTNQKGITLVEIVVIITIAAMVLTITTISFFRFRQSFYFDSMLNSIVESVNYAKLKSKTGKLNEEDTRISYGVVFDSDKYIVFEGDSFDPDDENNNEYEIPVGFSLDVVCTPADNGTIVFDPIIGETANTCVVNILNSSSDVLGRVQIDRTGISEAY